MRKFTLLLMLFLLVGTVSVADKAISIEVDVDSSLDPGERLNVDIEITNDDDENITTDDDIDIEIRIRGILVHEENNYHLSSNLAPDASYTITRRSTNFDVDGDNIWEDNLMDYYCDDDQEVEVELSGDVDTESDSDDFDLEGDELSFSMDPDLPSLNDAITITVLDEDDDEFEDASIKITYLDDDEWDADDKDWERDTNRDGERKITLDDVSNFDYGSYQIDVYADDYCKATDTFSVKHMLVVSDPEPAIPQAGKSFRVRVTDEDGDPVRGASAVLNPGPIIRQTDYSGYAKFTIDTAGDYQLIVTAPTYDDSPMKSIKITSAPTLAVTVSPSQPNIGKIVTITVKSGSAGVGSASVAVTLPGGTSKVLTTKSDGTVTFIPTVSGIYSIDASKDAYSTGTVTFIAISTFTVVVPDLSDKKTGDKITITVQDSSGNPVVAATVALVGTSISGTTDIRGQYSFNLPAAGAYTLRVTKDGFSAKEQAISLVGKLKIQLGATKAEMGDNVTVSALDDAGNKVSASIEVTLPDGTIQSIEGGVYVPKVGGNHSITVKKAGYTSASQTILVSSKSLVLDMTFKGNTLKVTATSHGRPVSDLTIEIKTPVDTKEATTDEMGIIEISAKEDGDYTARAKSDTYESDAVTLPKKGINMKTVLLILLAVVLIIILVIIIAVVFHLKKRGGIGKKLSSNLGR